MVGQREAGLRVRQKDDVTLVARLQKVAYGTMQGVVTTTSLELPRLTTVAQKTRIR
jgi:hypothetical protein